MARYVVSAPKWQPSWLVTKSQMIRVVNVETCEHIILVGGFKLLEKIVVKFLTHPKKDPKGCKIEVMLTVPPIGVV